MGQSNVTNVLKNQLFLLKSAILYSNTVLITFNVVSPAFLTVFCTFYCWFVYFIVLCLWNALHLYNFDHKSDLKEKLNYLEFQDQNRQEIHRQIPHCIHYTHLPRQFQHHQQVGNSSQRVITPKNWAKDFAVATVHFIQNKRPTFFSCNNCKDPEGKPIGLYTKIDCFKKFHEQNIFEKLFPVWIIIFCFLLLCVSFSQNFKKKNEKYSSD